MPKIPPRWPIPINDNAPLAGIDTPGGTVCDGIHKQQGITRLQVYLNGALYIVYGAHFTTFHLMLLGVRVGEIGFVTGRNDHRRTVAGTNIAKSHQNIDLSALETPVMTAKLVSLDTRIAAGVQADSLARPAQVGEVLVNENRAMVLVKGMLSANKVLDLGEPAWVINQTLERFAALVDLLKINALRSAIAMCMNATVPLACF